MTSLLEIRCKMLPSQSMQRHIILDNTLSVATTHAPPRDNHKILTQTPHPHNPSSLPHFMKLYRRQRINAIIRFASEHDFLKFRKVLSPPWPRLWSRSVPKLFRPFTINLNTNYSGARPEKIAPNPTTAITGKLDMVSPTLQATQPRTCSSKRVISLHIQD